MGRLTELSINNNKIKDVGVKALATADLSALEDLSLSFTFDS
jgi:Leucine-rich repeat (LRR) protein